MPDPIGTFSPEAVIEAIEADLLGASVALGRTEDGVVFRGSDVTWVYTGYRSLSRVLRARFAPEQAEDRVAEVGDCFREWDAPVCWVVGPSSFPPNLPELLADAGFDAGELWLGLARDLAAVDVQPSPTAGCLVARVVSKIDLDLWTHVAAANDGDGTEGGDHVPDPATADIFSPENAGGDPRCRYYLATVNNRPVARGMAYVQGDVVGLHWLACEPAERGRGYQRAVIRRALADARATGARLAVVAARGGVQPALVSSGFKPYCQFTVHGWPSTPQAHA